MIIAIADVIGIWFRSLVQIGHLGTCWYLWRELGTSNLNDGLGAGGNMF